MDELQAWAAEFGIALSSIQLQQFTIYEQLLLDWNDRVALTAIRDIHSIRIRHFLDSLTCATVTGSLAGQQVIDVGSGAGLPGLPLKILFPEMKLTMLESVGKKCRFLETVTQELGLSGVRVLNGRAEDVGQDVNHREQYDWAAARAVAELRVLVEYLLPFCRSGGRALAQKGESAAEELRQARHAIGLLGGGSATISPIHLPETEQTHNLVVIEKVHMSDPRYPRRAGVPTKRPL